MSTYSLYKCFFKNRSINICCFIAFLFSFTIRPSFSQDVNKRPEIGLVLSGGGAHGIAHLGVIKVMEEAGLKPDYITGVSMGSIIGGMYSIGYSADSLHKILKNLNWDDMLSNKMPENRIIFPEKAHFYNSVVSLPITSKKVVLPSGLNNGQLIENMLSYFAWPAAKINDFSKLPIPFMCLATDIRTYSKIKLKSGYLPDAIRASFSVPSIFTAHKIDTLLLLDGGLIRNFAATEAREMGSDIIIGSYVGFENNHLEELQSLPGIVEQIAMSRSLEDFNQEKKLVNILIKPDVKRFPIADFSNVDSLIYSGYFAALPFKERFRKLADSLDSFGAARPTPAVPDISPYTFDKIEINGNKVYSDYQILGVLDVKAGEPVKRDDLAEGIELLYGKAWFEKVKYRIVPRNDSLILAIDCEEKPRAMLYGSVHYDNSLLFGIILGVTLKNLLTPRSVINVNSYIGKYYRFKAGLLQYVDRNQKLGLSMNFSADNTLFPWLELNSETGNTLSRNQTFDVGINNYIGLNNILTLSGIYSETNLKPDYITDSKIINHAYNFLSSEITFARNNLDSKYFPHNGLILTLTAGISKLRNASVQSDVSRTVLTDVAGYSPESFYTFRAGIKQYISTGKKTTFSIGSEALFISDPDSISSENNFFLMGGIQPDTRRSVSMIGFQPNEIKVRRMAILRTELDIEFLRDLHLNIMADLAAAEDNNFPYELLVYSGYGLGLGYNSIIGPVKAGMMYGSYPAEKHFSNLKTYISIGYNF